NVLGEIGKGHRIAFGILNLGRLKLGVGTVAGARYATDLTIEYTTQRTQFQTPLSEFGLIQKKIAEQVIKIYAGEAMGYRITGLVSDYEHQLKASRPDDDTAMLAALDEYSVECAMSKVYGSEVLDFVVDEAVQAHGGYGYIKEYPVEQCYRDSRINRIYEGTNEINRMLVPGQLLKKAMKGEIPLMDRVQGIGAELAAPETISVDVPEGPIARERRDAELAKRAALFLLNEAVQKYMMEIDKQQEVLALLADILTEVFVLDSTVARVAKALDRDGPAKSEIPVKILQVFSNEAVRRLDGWGRELLAVVHEADAWREKVGQLEHYLRPDPLNTVALKREIARDAVAAGRYRFFS
ncbi:MAG: acyl-CoA dehydrogenase, partial [Myxococcales bacterium]|nr:acyl-CoA dehydrogenase [Myxococcales bacterium]